MARRGGHSDPGADLVTAIEAAAIWRVSRASVYNWIDTGILTCFVAAQGRERLARRREVLAAKVFRPRQLEVRGVSRRLLEQAIVAGLVHGEAGRFSLDDLSAVLGFGRGDRRSEATRGPHRPVSGIRPTALQRLKEQERKWVERGADPAELPDAHILGPDLPEVIAPEGIFLFTILGPVHGQRGPRYVGRSAGYDRVDGELVWFEADDRFAILGEREPLRPEWAESNHLYRLARARVVHERWRRRSATSDGDR
jgi:hypothetical protein